MTFAVYFNPKTGKHFATEGSYSLPCVADGITSKQYAWGIANKENRRAQWTADIKANADAKAAALKESETLTALARGYRWALEKCDDPHSTVVESMQAAGKLDAFRAEMAKSLADTETALELNTQTLNELDAVGRKLAYGGR